MVRPYSKQTNENFENHSMPVGRYIILRYHSFSYFLPSTIDLIVRPNILLITIVIIFNWCITNSFENILVCNYFSNVLTVFLAFSLIKFCNKGFLILAIILVAL